MNDKHTWNKAMRYRRNLNKKKWGKVIVYAYDRRYRKFGESGEAPVPIRSDLEYRLKQIGRIGKTKIGNTVVGCCAEVISSNSLLEQYAWMQINAINFTVAIRPKTMEIIRMCRVCRQTFNHGVYT